MPKNAASIMTRRVITARPDSSVADIARLLSEHAISAVPICAEDGALLGMISESDLLRPFREEHSLRPDWWLGVLSLGGRLAPALAAYIQQDAHCARDLMTQPVITACETATPEEIADRLLRYHIKRVPIVRDGRLVGIVSRANLITALALQRDGDGHSDWQPKRAGGDNPAPSVR